MLLHRVITAVILIAIALLVLFKLPASVFIALSSALTLYAAWEWTDLMGGYQIGTRILYLALVFFVSLLFAYYTLFIVYFLAVCLLWWLIQVVVILTYPKGKGWWTKGPWVRAFSGILILVSTFLSVNLLYFISPWSMLLLFILIWGSDTVAYFAGRAFGRRKLLPNVSPGKTWAGFWGAFLTSIIIGLLLVGFWPAFRPYWRVVMPLCVLTMLFSVLGDLYESMLKREVGLKDSGKLLPGHGGLLDRIDSLTAAAPLFAFFVVIAVMAVGL